MSKSQERPPRAEQIVNAVAQPLPDADFKAGVRRWGQREVTAGPAEQDSELCTMADFSTRVLLDELRGRGIIKGLQPEVLEQISRCLSAHAHGDEACTQLIAYTDGSACMTRAWPRLAAEARWGAVVFAMDAPGVWR